jgi:N-acetylmuramoyl-L-alanine amidase
MPSVLIELGFLTNKKEGRYLNSIKGQQQMGKAITDAIKNYINNLKLNTIGDQVVENSNYDEIEFKIQIASGKNRIATKSYNFKGLKNTQRVKVGSYYKYYYGATSSYKNALKSLKTAKKKGYKSAFIVAFKNGDKVSLKEVNK